MKQLRYAGSRILSLTTALIFWWSVAPAQIISDPTAAIQFRPSVTSSATGVPVVNITKPNFGTSHNQFSDYNVGNIGAILNNSPVRGLSQIGGQVQGNSSLGGTSASLIVNEVTSTRSSSLSGQTEVFGPSADVIIANPNGITCSGCSFINVPQATLSTGVPTINPADGKVTLSIRGGEVSIGALGLNGSATDLETLRLISRTVDINGAISAQSLVETITGSNDVDYSGLVETGDVAASTAVVSSAAAIADTVAVDASLLGSIVAETINIYATELGKEVATLGFLEAQGPESEGITISSQGALSLSGVNTSGALTLDALGDYSQYADLYAEGDIILGADNVWIADNTVTSTLVALSIEASGGIDSGSAMSAGTTVALSAGADIDLNNQIFAPDSIDITGDGGLKLTQGRIDSDTVTIDVAGLMDVDQFFIDALADDLSITAGSFQASDSVQLEADTGNITLLIAGDVTSGAQVEAQQLLLLSQGDTTLSSASELIADNLIVGVADHLTSAGVLRGESAVFIAATDLTQSASGATYGGAVDIDLSDNGSGAGTFNNAGSVASDSTLDIDGGGLTNSGVLESQSAIDWDLAGAFSQTGGGISTPGLFDLTATAFSLTGGEIEAQNFIIDVSGDFYTSRTLDAETVMALYATGDVTLDGAVSSGDSIIIDALGGDVSTSVEIQAATTMDIWLDGTFTNTGRVIAGSDLLINSTGGVSHYNSGTIATGSALDITLGSGDLFNDAGSIFAVAGMDIIIPGELLNRAGSIETLGDGTITAGSVVNERGPTVTDAYHINTCLKKILGFCIKERDDWYSDEREGTDAAVIAADGTLAINTTDGIVNLASHIVSGGDMVLSGDLLDNDARPLLHTHAWDIDGVFSGGGSGYNQWYTESPSLIEAGGSLDTAGIISAIENGGSTIAAGQVSLTAQTIDLTLTDYNVIAPPAATPSPVVDLSAYMSVLATGNGLFGQVNTGYLYGVNEPTIANAIDAQYTPYDFATELGVELPQGVQFFADPYAQQRLIREATANQLGRSIIDPAWINSDEQMQALYANALAFAAASDARFGEALTAEQQAALSEPIIWYSEQIIDGQSVLVPTLYLPEAQLAGLANPGTGQVISRTDLLIQSDGTVTNTGFITAGGDLVIVAEEFINQRRVGEDFAIVETGGFFSGGAEAVPVGVLQAGGVLGAQNIFIQTDGDLINIGGQLVAADNVTLYAGGSVINQAQEYDQVVEWDRGFWGTLFGIDSYDVATEFEAGQVIAGDQLVINAGGEVLNIGSEFGATNDVTITAADLIEQNVLMDSFTTEKSLSCGLTGCSFKSTQGSNVLAAQTASLAGSVIFTATDGDVVNRGSALTAFDQILIDASGDVIFTAESLSLENEAWQLGITPIRVSFDKQDWNEIVTAVSSVSASDITINAGNDFTGEGVQIAALNDLLIDAGRDIIFDAEQNQKYLEQSGLSLGLEFPGSDLINAVWSGASLDEIADLYIASNPLLSSIAAVGSADNGLELANALVRVAAFGGELGGQLSDGFGQAGIGGGYDGLGNAAADAFNPFNGLFKPDGSLNKASISVAFSAYQDKQEWTTSVVSQMTVGGDMTLIAGRDAALLDGTYASVGGDVTIVAERDFKLAALREEASSSSKSGGVSVGLDSFSVNYGQQDGSSTTFQNAGIVSGGDFTLQTGADATIRGGNITANGAVDLEVGGNLALASVQNASESDGFNAAANLSSSSFGLSGGVNEAERLFTDQISAITGGEAVTITVQDNTEIIGAVIDSLAGEVDLTTGALSASDLADYDRSRAIGGGIQVGGGALDGVQFNYANGTLEGVTRATVGDGEITVLDVDSTGSVAALNRDTNSVQIITKDQQIDISLNIPVKQLRALPDNIQKTVNLARALSAPVSDDLAAQGPRATELYRKAIANGASVEEAKAFSQTEAFALDVQMLNQWDNVVATLGEDHPQAAQLAFLILTGEQVILSEEGLAGLKIDCGGDNGPCEQLLELQRGGATSDAVLSFLEANGNSLSLAQKELLFACTIELMDDEGDHRVLQAVYANPSLRAGLAGKIRSSFSSDVANITLKFAAKDLAGLQQEIDAARELQQLLNDPTVDMDYSRLERGELYTYYGKVAQLAADAKTALETGDEQSAMQANIGITAFDRFKWGDAVLMVAGAGRLTLTKRIRPKTTDGVPVADSYVPSGSGIVKDGTVRLNQNIVTSNSSVIPAGSVVTESGGAIKVVMPNGTKITGKTNDLLGSNQLALGSGGALKVTAANPSASERAAAAHMARLGRNVELRDPVGTRAGGGTSDLLVDGAPYDVYTPTSTNPNRIISAIAKKNDQATGIVVDLSNSPVTADQLGNVLGRVNGAGATNITDIVIIGN